MKPDKIPLVDKFKGLQGLILKEIADVDQEIIERLRKYRDRLASTNRWLDKYIEKGGKER